MRSVLSSLLFNFYLNDLFHLAESTEVCNFAHDTAFCACDKDLKTLITVFSRIEAAFKYKSPSNTSRSLDEK